MPNQRLLVRGLALLLVTSLGACDWFKKGKPCVDTPTAPCSEPPPIENTPGTGLVLADAGRVQTFGVAGTPFSGATLPSSVDLSANLPSPGNQGQQNSCVGWAVGYGLKTYQERIERNWTLTSAHIFSPAYIYNQLNGGTDNGLSFEAALELLKAQGVASMVDMPYNPGDFRTQPTGTARSAATPYRIERWGTVNHRSTVEVKAHLSAGTPVLIGAIVDNGLMMLPPGEVWRNFSGPQTGAHAMLVVGYDDARSAFKILNSWGQSWSSGGYGWIDYSFFSQAVREAYVTLDVKGTTPSPTPTPPTPTPTPTPPTPTLSDIIAGVSVQIGEPNFNYFFNAFTPGILFHGSITVPAGGVATSMQLVVYFYYNNGFGGKGAAVGTRIPQFGTVYGTAATGTPAQAFPRNGLSTTWNAPIPYDAFNVARGLPFSPVQSNLVAEFVLFVDNYAVRSFGLMTFFVRL